MTLKLDAPTLDDLYAVLPWRDSCPEALRTSRQLTRADQEAFFAALPTSPHFYYAVREIHGDCEKFRCAGDFVALVSLENVSWQNGHAEIGLIVDPDVRGRGVGREAVRLALDKAFRELRLLTVWGECYLCGHPAFWETVVRAYGGSSVIWSRRKFWAGELHDAMLFTITREGWEAHHG